MVKLLLLSIIFFFLLPRQISAQVVINEFSSWDTSGDWVEFYASEDVDISGWIIRDTAASIVETIPGGVSIGPSSSVFYFIEVGNRLNKNGDIIKLYKDDDSSLVDQIPYGDEGGVCAPGLGQTAGRYPDGNSTIERFSGDTKGATNNQIQLDPCPTPSPTPTNSPTPTPKPTSTPKPTKTPTPTSTNTPTPKPTAKVTKKPTSTPKATRNESQNGGLTLGLRDELSITPTPGDDADSSSGGKFPWTAGLFILGGVGFIGAAAYPFIKKRGYNLFSEEKQKDS